jgi:hypothetical protein
MYKTKKNFTGRMKMEFKNRNKRKVLKNVGERRRV